MGFTLSVVVPTYNDWEQATRCVQAVINHSGDSIEEVLVIDDCSDEKAPSNFPQEAQIIRNEVNKGVVYSENRGFNLASSDIVIILDSDSEPLMEFAVPVIQAFEENNRLGALGLHTVDKDGNPTGIDFPEPTVWEYVVGQKIASKLSFLSEGRSTDKVCLASCATAYRKKAFNDLNGFDEGFDFSDYDFDFTIRLRHDGWEVKKSDSIRVYHEGGGSPQSTAKRVMRHHRNRWRLLKKHGKLQHPAPVKLLLFLRHLLEYGLLRVAGSAVAPDPAARQDKLNGREKLLRTVWSAYE